MAGTGERITHVSDTALMVAACRALETARADGLVQDPFAERLAGERGKAILNGITGWQLIEFGIAVRSNFVDHLVMETVAARGIECVVCAGAGLDTRPWRLELPAGLRWIEADFPEMLDYKAQAMAEEKPRCRLERIATDLADAGQRRALFDAVGERPGLLITEGLLMYLAGSTVVALADEAGAGNGMRHWMFDVSSLDLARMMGTDTRGEIESVRAEGHFKGEALIDAVRRHGWHELRFRSYVRNSEEIAAERVRKMREGYRAAGITVPEPNPADPSGVYLFGRG